MLYDVSLVELRSHYERRATFVVRPFQIYIRVSGDQLRRVHVTLSHARGQRRRASQVAAVQTATGGKKCRHRLGAPRLPTQKCLLGTTRIEVLKMM